MVVARLVVARLVVPPLVVPRGPNTLIIYLLEWFSTHHFNHGLRVIVLDCSYHLKKININPVMINIMPDIKPELCSSLCQSRRLSPCMASQANNVIPIAEVTV